MKYTELTPIFKNKRCAILGFGREGRLWLDILQSLDCCAEIAIADQNTLQPIKGVTMICGNDYLEQAKEYDLLLQSPGVIIKDKLSADEKEKILTQTELLLRLKPCKIIGVTGTKGKSTTSSLIHHFLQANEISSMLIGNIGIPPLERLEEMDRNMVVVCEMSCHQLEFTRHSPDVSVLLNIFPEHLDHYVDFNAYADAKLNICRYQRDNDTAIINSDIKNAETLAEIITASFGGNGDITATEKGIDICGRFYPAEMIHTKLCGKHNLYNIAVALTAVLAVDGDVDKCLDSLPDFNGLEHRLEYVATKNGVEYINDSICTIPEAAIAAIKAFDGTDCVILGGMDRGIPYDVLGEYLNTGSVRNVILLPDSGKRIGELITNPDVTRYYAKDLPNAVQIASEVAQKRVILCPAAASYGFYKNFEERGKHFKQLVEEL